MAANVGLVRTTAKASLLVQFVAGLLTVTTLFTNNSALQTIVWLEVVATFIEFLWYGIMVARSTEEWNDARYRYVDWVLSTPVMLVSFVFFFNHRASRPVHDLGGGAFVPVLLFNWAMLGFGFVNEWRSETVWWAVIGGFVFFVASFTILGTYVEASDAISLGTYAFNYVTWSLYGLAAVLPATAKQVSYNTLDLVAKNFLGVALFVYLNT